jgi:hypothetical protein
MKLVIDELTDNTGWVSSDTTKISIESENEVSNFIANDNNKSLLFHYKVNSLNAYVEKTFTAIDISEYDELVINVYSVRQKNKGIAFNSLSEFEYKIDFNGTMTDYMIPVYSSLTAITFDISSINSLDRIRITSNTNTEDYLIISHCVVVKDELPFDIFREMKRNIEIERNALNLNRKYQVGIVNGTTGDDSVQIEGIGSYLRDWIEKYSVIEIDDNTNSEIHQLMENDEVSYELGQMYDGTTLNNDYVNAPVYIYFPIEFGLNQREIILPGIGIYNIVPRPVFRGGKEGVILDSYDENSNVRERKELQIYEYEILMSLEARIDDLLADMQDIVKRSLSKEKLWINGRKNRINFLNDPIYIEAIDSWNQIPKIQYSMSIEIKEDRYTRETLPNTTVINTTYTIQGES